MAAEPGGIASKLGPIYERRYAIEQIIRLISGRLVRLRWEPATAAAGGADIELEYPDRTIEHVQLKRQNRADAVWTPAALEREGVATAAARVVDASPTARFAFVSSDPVPHLKDICDQLTRHNGMEADFIRERIATSKDRHACFNELLRRWGLTVGNTAHEARAVNRLRAMSFQLLDRGEEGDERVNMLLQAHLTGAPEEVSAYLASYLEANLGKDIRAQDVLDDLAKHGIRPRDLARDPSLPTAMLALRASFVESLRARLVAGTWIARSQVSEIINHAFAPGGPRVILVHGKPGAGKSGVQLGVVEQLIANGVPLLPLSLNTQPPEGTVLQYGEALGLRATPAAALRAVAGDTRAVLLVDQLDALRLTTSGATAAWGICAEMLREAARDPNTVLIVACRTFDLENDANIRRWKEALERSAPAAVIAVEIGDLAEGDVEPVLDQVGVNFKTLPPRLQRLLLHPSTLDAWHQLVVRGKAGRDFATQTQLLSALIDELRGEAVREHGATDREVADALAAARTLMERSGRLSAPASAFALHRAGLRACCGVGLLVRTGASLGFPHQSYYDHLVAVAALSESGYSPDQIVAWVKQDQRLERRDQLRQLLFLLHDEQPSVAAAVSGALLRDPGVRFHLKQLVLGVLREADLVSSEGVALIAELARDDAWREHVVGRLLWRSVAWFDALHQMGVWAQLIAQSAGDERVRWLRTIVSVMEDRPAEVDQLLAPILSDPGGIELMARALSWDPSEDSPLVAALRDLQIREGEWSVPDMMLDRVAKRDPARTVRLVGSVVRGMLRKTLERRDSENNEHVETLREGSLDKGVAIAVRSNAPASYPVLAKLIRLCERLERSCRVEAHDIEDLTPQHYRSTSFFHDLLQGLTTLTSHAVAGLADTHCEDLRRALIARAASGSPSLTRAIAAGLALSPDTASDQAIEWLLADPARLELEEEFGSDSGDVATEIVRRHARTCSQQTLDRLESVLLTLMPTEEKERYKYLVENYFSEGKWGYNEGGQYQPHINPIGRAQHSLMGAIPEERRSARVKDQLRVWDGKFGGPARSRPDSDSKGGYVGSPIPGDRVDRVTDEQWLDIVSRRWSRRWRQIGPDRIAEASPEHFANDMGAVAAKQPQRFVRLALKFPEDAPAVYFSRLWDAMADRAADLESCETGELDALVTRTVATGNRYALMAACRAIEHHPNAPWGPAMWKLLDLAGSHEDPKTDEFTVHSAGRPDVETTSLNCVRGAAASALAALAWDDSERCAAVKGRAATLAEDPHPAVKVAAAHTAYAVYTVDREAGVELLLKIAASPDDRVLAGRWLNQLVRFVRWSHRGVLHPLFERMSASADEEVAKRGARWISVERFQFNACQEAYTRCRQGSVAQRQGVAETLTHLVDDDHSDGMAVEADLIALFDDPDETVRAAAANVFRVDGVLESPAGPRLADAFVRSKAFVENSEDLIWRLSREAVDLVPYKSAVFASADRFAAELAEQTRSLQNRMGMAGRELSALLLRLYDAATKLGDRDLAGECLDRWDALLAARVGDSDANLDSLLG